MKKSHSDQETSKPRRGLKIVVVLLLVAAGLFVVRFGLGLGTAAVHYRSTPVFADYIAAHPVTKETMEERLPPGEAIAAETPWTTGSIDPLGLSPGEGDFERADRTLLIDITRGDEILLSFRQEFSLALRRSDWTHHGVHIAAATMQTAPGLRAVTVTSISDPEEMVGEDSMAKGGAIVDVFLISGEGQSESRLQRYPGGNVWSGGAGDDSIAFPDAYRSGTASVSGFSLWRKVTGITHNTKPLPAEGLIHHVRQRVGFDWKIYENGSGDPSTTRFLHAVNTAEYSHDIKITLEASNEGEPSSSSESTKNLRRTWNGEVW